LHLVSLLPGLDVTPLCFGTLTLGPLQKGLSPDAGGRLLRYAFDAGINFFDTAELYGTYDHLRVGLGKDLDQAVISSKSYAFDAPGMTASVDKARRGIGRDYIDIFLLHEQESLLTLRGHREALETLLKLKQDNIVRAVGISTHYIRGVRAAMTYPEIDIIHPLINIRGIGIADGTCDEMSASIREAAEKGKGIYAMKALAGGALFRDAAVALSFVRALPGVKSVAVGMGSVAEIEANMAFFATGAFPASYTPNDVSEERKLIVEPWCVACGECVPHCRHHCLEITEDKLRVDSTRCVLCGYCVPHCPNFYLKVI